MTLRGRIMSGSGIYERWVTKWRLDEETGCWVWIAARDDKGYGRFGVEGRNRRAHIVGYQLLVGEIPAGLELDHLCENKSCVNPEHLEPVTRAENVRRGRYARTRRARTHCQRGHAYGPNPTIHKGGRECRTCRNENRRRRRAER